MKSKSYEELKSMLQEGRIEHVLIELSQQLLGKDEFNLATVKQLTLRYNLLQRDRAHGTVNHANAKKEEVSIVAGTEEFIEKWFRRIVRILFLGANPVFSSALALDHEVEKIEAALQASRYRDRFILLRAAAVRPKDFAKRLLTEKPDIVHFSGHGTPDGLIMLDDHGNIVEVRKEKLGLLFELFDSIQCLILNACHSLEVARSVRPYLDPSIPIIAMSDKVIDDNAILFSQKFYEAIGEGKGYPYAFQFAKVAVGLVSGNDDADELLEII